jgi:hypothetical protein
MKIKKYFFGLKKKFHHFMTKLSNPKINNKPHIRLLVMVGGTLSLILGIIFFFSIGPGILFLFLGFSLLATISPKIRNFLNKKLKFYKKK